MSAGHEAARVWYPLSVNGIDLSITTPVVTMWVVCILILLFFVVAVRIPKWRGLMVFLYDFVTDTFAGKISTSNRLWVSFLLCLFLFVFLNNVSGLVPGNESPMANINGTGSLALMVLVISQCSGLLTHGLHHFKNLVPGGIPAGILPFMVPLEIISLLAKPFSLAIRLFANMFAGHAVLMIFAGLVVAAHPLIKFLPFGGVLLISVFEVFVSFIQAFIFVYLTSLYVGDAVHAEH